MLLILMAAAAGICVLAYRGWQSGAPWWLALPGAAVLARVFLEVVLIARASRTGRYDAGWHKRTRDLLTWGVLAAVFALIVKNWR